MLNRTITDYLSYIIIIGLFLFVLEIAFFDSGLIFTLLFSAAFIYFGRIKWHWLIGKVIFIIGLISLILAIAGMMTFKFLILATIIYFIFKLAQSKQAPMLITPNVETLKEQIVEGKLNLFRNKWFGTQKTPDHSYTWEDINIQCGVGDTTIDLSNTVFPKGEAVIIIRNIVGNVQVSLPYDVEVSIQHSSIVGTTTIFNEEKKSLVNVTAKYQTENYQVATSKVKIFTSLYVGNLEVKRS
ncbi:cell wall-active antibiotics response protein LiaF [Bacillus alkalisoli]|uniref:cell wall-active antibiotics response protein LiaF n=1 Tax=Bacillus alkalisoli TaxID=2011008 RepID=UPI000C248A73|nr:cell wall-active antibiotics response protein LiaF [Bacillus alkalisoli]